MPVHIFCFSFLLLVDMFLFCARGSHCLVLFFDACWHVLCFYFVIHIHRLYTFDLDVKFYYNTALNIDVMSYPSLLVSELCAVCIAQFMQPWQGNFIHWWRVR
jgi:hypothetical protein